MRTYRRQLLDNILELHCGGFSGDVLDIGGKRENKRGYFRPDEQRSSSWKYINIDPSTKPDIVADAAAVPLPDKCADWVICTEVLEHVRDPSAVVSDIYRLLRPNGSVLCTVPFLYPVHADPFDFQRFTSEGLKVLFSRFSKVEVVAMGSEWRTLAMLAQLCAEDLQNRLLRGVLTRFFRCIATPRNLASDLIGKEPLPRFTTGYAVVATR